MISTMLLLAVYFSKDSEAVENQIEFKEMVINGDVGHEDKKLIREVNPNYRNIQSWISSVGAAVAINDINGDGFSNDLCMVDPRFNNVTVQSLIGEYEKFQLESTTKQTIAPMGCVPADINEDGRQDIVVYYWGRSPLAFIQKETSDPLSSESFQPKEIVENIEMYSNTLTFSDIDGDGHLDMVVGNYFPDASEVLNKNSVKKPLMQDSMSQALNGGTNRIYLWSEDQGDYLYKDVSSQVPDELLNGWTLGIGVADLNKDGLPDIYAANDFGPDRLLLNKSQPGNIDFTSLTGKKDWKTPRSEILGLDSFKGMGVEFVDLNRDGWLDILVSNIAEEYALMESHFAFINTGEWEQAEKGIAPFENQSVELGLNKSSWGWDIKSGDFNNDGKNEVIQATGFIRGEKEKWHELQELATINDELLKYPNSWPKFIPGTDISGKTENAFFIQNTKGRYGNYSDVFGSSEKKVGRGIAIADVNGDGLLDFALANQWDQSSFYLNKSKVYRQFYRSGYRLFNLFKSRFLKNQRR
ncbi:VCBS repeat-containing protein [Diaphorobacter sp. DS2]|nr:VCBS repeat-containing protein [Diaphorobacter sp. DS2]